MIEYNVEPWPSTYQMIRNERPMHFTSRFGRQVGAMRVAIPPHTVEPVQIHLISPRDEKPFEEMLADFSIPFHVAYFDLKTGRTKVRQYAARENIVIPEFVPHWLINTNDKTLEFTCEYGPHPWKGEVDEPEFRSLHELLAFVDQKGLREKLVEASGSI